MTPSVYITGIASVSPLGHQPEKVWKNYLSPHHCFSKFHPNGPEVAFLNSETARFVDDLRAEQHFKSVDQSVLYAIAASRLAVEQACWGTGSDFGINIGSSRGATALFEKNHRDFLRSGVANTLSSPTTTLGNVSSWVAQDLQTRGPEISHSVTCSTALHAMLNGVAWLRSGMSNKFLVGGSEAPLTEFTLAQIKALKIYSRESGMYPSRALDIAKTQNSMVLGEGASVCCLETGLGENALAVISGVGYATELLQHSISISTEADCFQRSMRMAIGSFKTSDIDAVVMHAPGTIKGDASEYKAIERTFGSKLPLLTTNKWKIGHTFGASGMLSVEMAVMMLTHQQFIGVPFFNQRPAGALRNILVNSVGFGGNAVSILLSRP